MDDSGEFAEAACVQENMALLANYYQLLGKLASKHGAPRWLVEEILHRSFQGTRLWRAKKPKENLVIDINETAAISYKEADRAVARWARKFGAFTFYVEELDIQQ